MSVLPAYVVLRGCVNSRKPLMSPSRPGGRDRKRAITEPCMFSMIDGASSQRQSSRGAGTVIFLTRVFPQLTGPIVTRGVASVLPPWRCRSRVRVIGQQSQLTEERKCHEIEPASPLYFLASIISRCRRMSHEIYMRSIRRHHLDDGTGDQALTLLLRPPAKGNVGPPTSIRL